MADDAKTPAQKAAVTRKRRAGAKKAAATRAKKKASET
jgi:hypothetical protein